jgi:hypothetical protein
MHTLSLNIGYRRLWTLAGHAFARGEQDQVNSGLQENSVALPCMLVGAINGKIRWDAHWEHKAHEPPMSDKPEYAYQNIRTKNYFWGDGDKVSLAPRLLNR